jgi:hypothetical protein
MTTPYQKFNNHRVDARRRGIEFLFTFEEWWAWWQVDNRWENRGRGANQFVMARHGDQGPYAPWNVRCTTARENTQEKDRDKFRESVRQAHARRKASGLQEPLAVRGSGHPRSKPVITPAGKFESGWLAADHHGLDRNCLYHRIKSPNFPEYRWAE